MRRVLLPCVAVLSLLACGTDAATSLPVDGGATDAADVTSADATVDAGDDVLRRDASDDAEPDAVPDAADVVDAGEDSDDGGTGDPCADAPEEPNESRAAAFTLSDGLELDAVLCRDDADWFTATLPPDTALRVEIAFSHETGDLELSSYLGDSEELDQESVTATDVEALQVGPFESETVVFIEVYGFRNETGPYRLTSTIVDLGGDDTVRVGGVATYEDRVFDANGFTGEIDVLPARQVDVEVTRGGIVVASGTTDDEGRYALDVPAAPGAEHEVRLVSRFDVDGFVVTVNDRTGASALYLASSETFVPEASAEVNLVATEDGVGGAFNILDVTLDAVRFVAERSEIRPPALSYAWQRPLSYSCGSCYSDNRVRLGGQLEDPDEYDDHIILHEFGHFFVEHFSADDSPGGAHRDRQVEPLLEYGEGLAYFWAAMVVDDPVIVDNFQGDRRTIDFENATQNGEVRDDMFGTADGTAFGNRREEVSGAILWDLYDPAQAAEPFDRIELGADGMMDLLLGYFGGGRAPVNVGQRGIELTDFLNAVVCEFPEVAGDIQPILDARGFPWDPVANANCDY